MTPVDISKGAISPGTINLVWTMVVKVVTSKNLLDIFFPIFLDDSCERPTLETIREPLKRREDPLPGEADEKW